MNLVHRSSALAAATLLAACAGTLAPVNVPPAIATAPHQSLAMSVAAKGVQIYECRATAQAAAPAAKHEWAFVAPEAELFDGDGHTIGRHGAGPHWAFEDGTRITGRVTGRAEAPQAGAIPWLLIESRATPPNGPLNPKNDLRSIQRVNTTGGKAPAEGCRPEDAGSRVRVPYTADYLFYSAR
ncbi:MAG: DUF3455 domain-containing protein [Burkholderiales bacterium]|nr:DUF3455 domain-containing protein [Burkholderiales bacterium]